MAKALNVFDDQLLDGVEYQPFLNTDVSGVSVDSTVAYQGSSSLKFQVPDPGDFLYLGGVLVSDQDRDLTGYNALTFYARASENISLNFIGLGNDNTGNSQYEATRSNVNLTGEWSLVVLPIPAPSRMGSERGLFTIAENLEHPHLTGYDIHVDEIEYVHLLTLETYRPTMNPLSEPIFVGWQIDIFGTRTIFRNNGTYIPVDHSPRYFNYTTTDAGVSVVQEGAIKAVGPGTARVTATIEDVQDPESSIDVLGSIDVTAFAPPTIAAPQPVYSAQDVISLFSDVYEDVPVDSWRADWGGVTTQVHDYIVDQDTTKMYSSLNWVGVEFFAFPIDASSMTHFHLDVYVPGGTEFKFFLESFPGGGSDGFPSNEIVLDADSTPAFATEEWVSLNIPLTDMQPETPEFDWSSLSRLVFTSADARLVLVDNVLFLDGSLLTPVSGHPRALPELLDAWPNPFNPRTTMAFEIPGRQVVSLRVFDLSGRLVRDLIAGESRTPGRHEVVWNGRDDSGRQVASGTYFYRLEAGEFAETKRMVLVK